MLTSLSLLGGCALAGGLDSALSLQLAQPQTGEQEPPPTRTDIAASPQPEPDWVVRQCRPPQSLCGLTVNQLEQGAVLDFRASAGNEGTALRLRSPFAVMRIEPLDRGRCPAKLCAAHVALAALLEEFLREGYYTQSVALLPGSAVITLRTERIDRTLKVLKGSCRFNLDARCTDLDAWLQDDKKSGAPCGFAQTRVFVAAAAAPAFVGAASFTGLGAAPVAGPEVLRSASFDAAAVKVYELVYVHKICRNEMTLVRNG
jgi:hypothetical protein